MRRTWHTKKLGWLLSLLSLLTAGCSDTELDRSFGKRRGVPGGASVNGTAVLAEMYELAGHTVNTWRRLSPRLYEADVIVWAPDNFQPPSNEARQWLEEWLAEQPGRTLVFIGRDYEAAIDYWERMLVEAPPEENVEILRRLAEVHAENAGERMKMPQEESAQWFVVRREIARREVKSLRGPWSEGIDADKTDIIIGGRLEIPDDEMIDEWVNSAEYSWSGRPSFETLLASEEDVLVANVGLSDWRNSKIVLVANGSFLLNLPLVNHEHRKLAQRVIEASGPPGRVFFLESGSTGVALLDHDPDANTPTGLAMFTVWPLGIIILHLAALGLLLAWACFPIFGRARTWEVASTSDFGQHVAAVGELLEKTQDGQYALERVKYYREHVRRETGTPRSEDTENRTNEASPRGS